MDKIQAEYNKKKDKDGSSGRKSSASGSQNLEEYADSSLQEMLYGPNSALDQDNFIQSVLQTIGDHKDLSKEFRRFLHDDIEEDEESIDRKYWQFRRSFMAGGGEMLDNDIEVVTDEQRLINKLKGVAQ